MSTRSGGLAVPGGSLPRITLVTPSFNQAEYLEATLASVLDQGYPDLEYIVVDGGSTDGSVEILRRHASRLSHWVSEPDRGHGHALNKGFARSTGAVMGWINSDDILLPGSLLLVGSLFAQFAEMEWLTSPGVATEPLGRIVATHPKTPWTRARFMGARDRWIQQESTFWRRSLWQRAGAQLSEALLACDHELWARFFRHARLYQTDGLIGAFRYRPDQRSLLQRERYLSEMEDVFTREAAAETAALPDDEAEVFSEIWFDTERLEFDCRHTSLLLTDRERALCRVDTALLPFLQLRAVEPPSGGVEDHPGVRRFFPKRLGSGTESETFVWLGSGPSEGLSLALHSSHRRAAQLRFLATPGPSNGGQAVTLRLEHRAGEAAPRSFDLVVAAEGSFACELDLAAGRNVVALQVVGAPAIADLGTGDPRHLMAAVCAIVLTPGAAPSPA